MPPATLPIPEVGQAVRVRNRLATVRAVEPYDSRHDSGPAPPGRGRIPGRLSVSRGRPVALGSRGHGDRPRHDLPAQRGRQPPRQSQRVAGVRQCSSLDPAESAARREGIEDEPLMGVWNSAIQVHAYQLEPVLRALQMPRVSLLLADGVGLGKTIQAGLVLEELLLRRRIRRILVLCPAMLQRQWKIELRRKFNLDFEVIDSDSTFQLRRRLGIDTNPWKAFPRIITSMDYLRMPDVLQQFLQASGAGPSRRTARKSAARCLGPAHRGRGPSFRPRRAAAGPASGRRCCERSASCSSIASLPRPRRTTARRSASPACWNSSTRSGSR